MEKAFPPIAKQGILDPADHVSAIDYVNRVNWLFETWDVEGMINSFTPDAVAFHFHGTIRGHKGIRHFFEVDYPYLIPGVSRHATNHIVDKDGDGVVVRYHNLLVRHAWPEDAVKIGAGEVMESGADLPAIWLYSPMRDRLVKTSEGWKIWERYIGGSTTNSRLSPPDTKAESFTKFMPQL
ncbi:nuclear transport factor 2 family protein [Rhizobium sp. Rhizsp42]|uniref:nuclear transport factor 2 family protein n=1 Tax=Rhizobium sp. Rhizsp42 TaxID=3243034 RepID=UPI0039B02517